MRVKSAFTIVEFLMAVGIASVVLASAAGLYLLGMNANKKSRMERELAQNGRVAIERITREIRQTSEIATLLPEQESDNPCSEILFRDGQSEEINYIRYYLEGDKLRRQEGFYYFSFDENKTHITWNSLGPGGESSQWEIERDEIAAENFLRVSFFGSPLVKMRFLLAKAEFKLNFASAVLGRNIN